MCDWLERRPSHPGTMVVGFLMIERRWWQFTRGTWCTDVAIPLFQIRGTARGRGLGFLVVWAFSFLPEFLSWRACEVGQANSADQARQS